ncbi:MAG: hypothetical protein EBY22_07120 [Gammaproteobacteria bacterium]|nr:hypothetical protein [Gammaproteobacteria bacterium]
MVQGIKKLITGTASRLVTPRVNNGTFLYLWSPGYNIVQKNIGSNGKEIIKKKFIPTTTFDAALAYLKKKHGPEDYLKFKEDAHPGHVAVEAGDDYLSAGADASLGDIGLQTQHKINFSLNFGMDILSFGRAPEKMVDFYTLNPEQTGRAIGEFKKSQLIYSLLGNRLFRNDGESCATSAFIVLEAGGIQELQPMSKQLLAKHGILTPALLSAYAEEARANEQESFPEVAEFSGAVLPTKSLYAKQMLEVSSHIEIEQTDTIDDVQNEDDVSNTRRGSPK